MNNSENVGIFDALLPQESETDQPVESAVETEVQAEVEAEVAEEAQADTETSNVSEEVDESEESEELSEDTIYQIGDKEYSLKQLEELESNGLRQSDYTKKTQEIAEQRKNLEASQAKLDESLEKITARIADIDGLLTTDSEIDMEYLRDNDPSEYLKQKELIEARQKAAESAKGELEALQQEQRNAKIANEQQLLLNAIPEWQDPATLEKESKMINEYLGEAGFTPDDTNDLINHKVYVAIREAALYRGLKSKSVETEKKVKAAPKVVKASVKTNKKAESKGINSPHNSLANALYS